MSTCRRVGMERVYTHARYRWADSTRQSRLTGDVKRFDLILELLEPNLERSYLCHLSGVIYARRSSALFSEEDTLPNGLENRGWCILG